MTSFNESDVNRAADGKFAAKTTGESSMDSLPGVRIGDLAPERFAVRNDELSDMTGLDIETARSDWDEVAVTTSTDVPLNGGVDETVRDDHSGLINEATENAYEMRYEGETDGGIKLSHHTSFGADTAADAVAYVVTNRSGQQELHRDIAQGRVGQRIRQTFYDWDVDPDRSTSGTIHPDLSSDSVVDSLGRAPVWKKTSPIQAERAEKSGSLTTTMADGTVETTNSYNAGDYIVTNPSGEQYAMSAEKFSSRYEQGDDGSYVPKGKVRALYNPTGHDLEVTAPWGEKQFAQADCYIVETYDGDHPEERSDNRYLIAGREFRETYSMMHKDEL